MSPLSKQTQLIHFLEFIIFQFSLVLLSGSTVGHCLCVSAHRIKFKLCLWKAYCTNPLFPVLSSLGLITLCDLSLCRHQPHNPWNSTCDRFNHKCSTRHFFIYNEDNRCQFTCENHQCHNTASDNHTLKCHSRKNVIITIITTTTADFPNNTRYNRVPDQSSSWDNNDQPDVQWYSVPRIDNLTDISLTKCHQHHREHDQPRSEPIKG